MKRPAPLPSLLAILLGVSGTSCRREAGTPGEASNSATERAAKPPAEHPDESPSATKKRGPGHEAVSEDEPGWVTLDASVLATAPSIHGLGNINSPTKERVLAALDISLEQLQEIKKTNKTLLEKARQRQLEMLGPVEFALDKTVTVPALEEAQIEQLRQAFDQSLSEDLPEKTKKFLEQLFLGYLHKEYGTTLRITLRDTGTIDTISMRHLPQEMLGLWFVVEGSAEGTYQLSPGQDEGGRFGFLKVPPGVKGSVKFK